MWNKAGAAVEDVVVQKKKQLMKGMTNLVCSIWLYKYLLFDFKSAMSADKVAEKVKTKTMCL